MYKSLICSLWFLVVTVYLLPARGDELHFEHLTIEDGLSQSAVYALMQDKQGFIWIGTKDGLNRFDGINIKIFRHDPRDSSSLSTNYITELYQDRDGYIWVGTVSGLERLDPTNGTFKHYVLPMKGTSVNNQIIRAVSEDAFGRIWVGTKEGLYMLPDKNRPRFTAFLYNPRDSMSISHNTVRRILLDSSGQTWVATFKGLNRILTDNEGTVQGFRRYYPHLPLSESTTDYENISMFEDDRGMFWLGNVSGLTRFNPKNGRFRIFNHGFSQNRGGWGSVYDLIQGPGTEIWGVTAIGLILFDTTRQTFRKLVHDPQNPFSLNNSILTRLIRDKSGVIWVGTNGYGLNIFNSKRKRFKLFRRPVNFKSLIDRFSVTAVLKSSDGRIWISADVLYELDPKTSRLVSYETDPKRPSDFGNAGFGSLTEDDKGHIWAAGYEGVYRYNPRTKKIRHFSRDTGLMEKVAYKVLQSRDKNIWIVTASYLSRYGTEEGTFRHYKFETPQIRHFTAITDILEDENGKLWLATDNGLIHFDPEQEKFTYYKDKKSFRNSLAANKILSITLDPRRPQRLWLGTSGLGLARYDVARDSLLFFDENSGLPNNVVYAALPDGQGNLWLSTNRGLCRFNRTTHAVENYDVNDGLQSSEFNTGAYFLSPDGQMFFGGIKGLNYFYPEDIKKNQYRPSSVLTGLRIFNKPASHKSNPHILDSLISAKQHLILSYRENIFTLEFAALDYSEPRNNRYAYRMLGFNENWIQAGRQRSATFTNLPPGQYTFQVRGANNDGVRNEQPLSLMITIQPPFYKTWWAYGLYGVLFLAALWGVRRYEMNRLLLKNRLRIGEMEGEKIRELSQLKSRFFANISHEFRTPLTLILGPLENLYRDIKNEKHRTAIRVMQRNARQLLKLINQILDLSRLDAGKMPLNMHKGDFVPFVKGLVMGYQSLAETKNIRLDYVVNEKKLITHFDPEKLESVINNLLSNSFKFTPDGGRIRVAVKASATAFTLKAGEPVFQNSPEDQRRNVPGKNSIEVTVSDTGEGIPYDQRENIFNRFYQVDGPSKRVHDGTGIGLALVKEMIELHGGFIEVSGREKKGTTFVFYLPYHPGESEETEHVEKKTTTRINEGIPPADDKAERVAETATVASGNIKSEKNDSHLPLILVVEDNDDVRAYIRENLHNNFNVIEADDGRAGVEQAIELIPDLIISDLMMPKLDGFGLCKRLKTDMRTSHIPIILLTARAASEDRIEGLETGADDYLVKPFSFKELIVRVKNLIDSRRKLRERFSALSGLKPSEISINSADEVFLKKVMQSIENNLANEKFNLKTLSADTTMSERQLQRKLKALTDQSPRQFIRTIRLQRARGLLLKKAATVSEIAYMCGFGSVAYFTKCFREQFGVTPGAVVEKQ